MYNPGNYFPGLPIPLKTMFRGSQNGASRGVTLEQVSAVLEFSPVPTAILQWNKLRYMNPAGLALLGPEEAGEVFARSILRWTAAESNHEICRKRIAAWSRQAERIPLTRKRWFRDKGNWKRRVGRTLIAEVKAWSIPLPGGDATQITFTDVTPEDWIEQTDRREEEQTKLAIEAGAIGTWNYDPATGKIQCSRRTKDILGLHWNSTVEYASFLALLHPEDRARTDRAVQQSLNPASSGEFGSDYRILCPDGKVRWIAAKGHAFFSDIAGRHRATRLTGICLDMTDLRQTDASLLQTEKLAVTGRLAASLAHEINNPLEAITNLLYLLQDGSLQEEQRKYVRMAEQEVARVIDVAVQTLRFYHDPGAPIQCKVAEIIDSAITPFNGRIAASDIEIERRYGEDITVLGAREELRQVLVNMVLNATNAMPHGGRLLVRAKQARNWKSERKGVRLTIADTGHGMNYATMKRIFEPFFTTRAAVGTGLGLWLCHGIVQKHGGEIRVKSRQSAGRSGTVFCIFLPFDRRR